MKEVEITTITSRGQVTIPQSFRDKEHIQAGDKMLVRDVDGYIVMKKINKTMLKDFFSTMKQVGKHVNMEDVRQGRRQSEKTFTKKTKKWRK